MRVTKKFLSLPRCKRRLLLRSALLLASARVGLAIIPFHALLRTQARMTARRSSVPQHPLLPPEQIGWAITVAGRYVPGAQNCLVQALATTVLLHMAGHSGRLCIGVGRDGGDLLGAHAWVELDGSSVIGVAALPHYARLFSWDGGRV